MALHHNTLRAVSHHAAARRRRGSTLPLVLALLALLTTVALALVYTSRLEVLAANNAGLTVKARFASLGGLASATAHLSSQYGAPTSPAYAFTSESTWLAVTDAADLSARINVNEVAPYDAANAPIATVAAAETPAAAPTPSSARSNIRPWPSHTPRPTPTPTPTPTVTGAARVANGHVYTLPATVFERFLAVRLASANLPSSLASPLAQAILAARDAMPEQRFQYPAEILSHVPLLTPPVFRALEPYLTTASTSLEVWRDGDGNAFVPVPVNTASALEILTTLRALYPRADLQMLRQFAANVVDRRDPSGVPTVFDEEPGALPVIGYKTTVVVSEVVPNVASLPAHPNRGQYVEVHNPLTTAADLTGWRLAWSGGSVPLDGTLEAGAYLILTDDLKGDNDPPEERGPGIGSFYDVFHVLPTGQDRIVELRDMDLPDDAGVVGLYDKENHLIDYLSYTGATFNGLNRGFEKTSPFYRVGRAVNTATPFGENAYVPANEAETYCWQQFQENLGQPFTSETDLLCVPTAYARTGALAPVTQDNFPLLAVGQGLRLDLRLADAFTAGDVKPAFDADGALQPCLAATDSTGGTALRVAETLAPPSQGSTGALGRQRDGGGQTARTDGQAAPSAHSVSSTLAPPRYSLGKVNLNTAPADVLAALPGFDGTLAAAVVKARQQTAETDREAAGAFASFADFADHAAVWSDLAAGDRLDALRALRPYVTCNSATFLVSSTNRREPLGPDERAATRVRTLARVELGEGARAHVVEWNFVKP